MNLRRKEHDLAPKTKEVKTQVRNPQSSWVDLTEQDILDMQRTLDELSNTINEEDSRSAEGTMRVTISPELYRGRPHLRMPEPMTATYRINHDGDEPIRTDGPTPGIDFESLTEEQRRQLLGEPTDVIPVEALQQYQTPDPPPRPRRRPTTPARRRMLEARARSTPDPLNLRRRPQRPPSGPRRPTTYDDPSVGLTREQVEALRQLLPPQGTTPPGRRPGT
jgi:hypothetical protein